MSKVKCFCISVLQMPAKHHITRNFCKAPHRKLCIKKTTVSHWQMMKTWKKSSDYGQRDSAIIRPISRQVYKNKNKTNPCVDYIYHSHWKLCLLPVEKLSRKQWAAGQVYHSFSWPISNTADSHLSISMVTEGFIWSISINTRPLLLTLM